MAQGFVNPTSGNTGGYNQIFVTTTATLTSSAFGNQVLMTGSSAYAVTLPSATGNGGRYIDFQCLTTSNALVTITPASGTIQGQSTFILGSGESCRVYCDGTNWWIQNLVLQPVALSAYLTSNGTTTGATFVKVQIDHKISDIGGFYDNTVNYRYTPLYPGLYEVNLSLAAVPALGGNQTAALIYKNGSQYALAYGAISSISGPPNSKVIPMDGSTDYLEWYVFDQSASGNGTVYGLQGSSIYTGVSVQRITNLQ